MNLARCQEPEDSFRWDDAFLYWLVADPQSRPSVTFSLWMIPRWEHRFVPCEFHCDDYPRDISLFQRPCVPQWYVEGLSGCAICWDLWGNDCNCYCSEVNHG
jgi:hypothetical protein